jgi:hypothetical protein
MVAIVGFLGCPSPRFVAGDPTSQKWPTDLLVSF